MTTSCKFFSILLLVVSLQARGFAQTPAGVCGSQQFCAETNDFIATVTTFRVSTNNVYQQKIIDTTVRFQNQTDRPLILGYVDHSGIAMDEQGNRSIPWGPNAYRGIGLVAGNSFDPKLVLRPGGWGEAQFELVQQGAPKVVGLTYAVDLTIDEINSSGNQHTLGGEFPLHFQGLSNGAAGAAPAIGALASAAAGGPCGLSGGQGAAGKASSTVSNAANTLSNLGSIFGKKKTAQNAGQVADAAAGCNPGVNNTAALAGTVAGAAAASNAPQTPSNPQTTGELTTATGGTPANLAADAYAKSKQGQSRGQQQQQKPTASATAPAQAAPQHIASAHPAAEVPNGQASSTAEQWTPPAEGSTPAARKASASIEPAKMPDVIGVHLGMDPKEALAIMSSHYPKNRLTPYDNNMSTFPAPVFQGAYVNPANNFEDDFNFQTTLPPEKQMVWKVKRITKGMHINRGTLLAALRAKYGKESAAIGSDISMLASNDSEITALLWLFDESGHHVQAPNSGVRTAVECSTNTPDGPGKSFLLDEAHGERYMYPRNGWCATSYIGVYASFGGTNQIIEMVTTEMMDLPLAFRTSHSTTVWYRAQAEKARQEDLEKSKKAKAVF